MLNTVSQLRLMLVVALFATLLLAAVVASPVGMHAQQQVWRVPLQGLSVTPGDNPGEIRIDWDESAETPEDYRVTWALEDEDIPHWTDEEGNAFPTERGLTVSGLDPGDTYKVKVRARFVVNGNKIKRTPWTELVTGSAAIDPPPVEDEPTPIVPTPSIEWIPGTDPTLEPLPDDPDSVHAGATDFGDVTFATKERRDAELDGDSDSVDYFSFTLTEPRFVRIDAKLQDANADLSLEEDDGEVIMTSTNPGTEVDMILADLWQGTYFLRLEAKEPAANNLRVVIITLAPDLDWIINRPEHTDEQEQDDGLVAVEQHFSDCADDDTTVCEITSVPGIGSSRISGLGSSNYETEWFKVTLEQGKHYSLVVDGVGKWGAHPEGGLNNPRISRLIDPNGDNIPNTTYQASVQESAGYFAFIHYTASQTGVYHLVISADNTGNYTLLVDVDEPKTINTPVSLTLGELTTARMSHCRDVDWFKVELEAGTTYTVEILGTIAGRYGRLINPELKGIYDSSGQRIMGTPAYDGGSGSDVRTTFTPSSAGFYYVSTSVEPATKSWKCMRKRYQVRVSDGVPDDYSDGRNGAGTVEVGGRTFGEFAHGVFDRDWFSVSLNADQLYIIQVSTTERLENGLPRGWADADVAISGVSDSNGNNISNTRDLDSSPWADNARLEFIPSYTGTFYIQAMNELEHDGEYGEGIYFVAVDECGDMYTRCRQTIPGPLGLVTATD